MRFSLLFSISVTSPCGASASPNAQSMTREVWELDLNILLQGRSPKFSTRDS